MRAGEFFHWWRTQLLELLPAALRGSWQGSRHTLTVRLDGRRLELLSPTLGATATAELTDEAPAARPAAVGDLLGRLPGPPQRITLVLAPDEYLLRSLSLPRAAQGNLVEAVEYQLPQLTPFAASQLIYACGEAADSPSDGPISVWLVAVPRQRIARALAMIGQTPPSGYLPLARQPSHDQDIEFNWSLREPSRANRAQRRLAWLGLGLLCLAVLGLHLYHQRQAQHELEQTLAELRLRATDVSALRDRLAAAEAQAAQLVAARQSALAPLAVLDVLTEQLDDQTWLEGLAMSDGRLRVRGVSAAPAELIETLEASTMLKDVRFESAITRDGRGQGDRFNISATLESAGTGAGS